MKSFSFLLVVLTLSFTSCNYVTGKRVEGDGVSSSQDRQVGSFSGVTASGSIDIVVTNGATNSLKIEADQNLLQYIETENRNGVVEVSTKDGYNLRPKSSIKVYATAPSFSTLGVSGSGTIKSNGKIVGGSNQENAAFPSGTCAERTTVPTLPGSSTPCR